MAAAPSLAASPLEMAAAADARDEARSAPQAAASAGVRDETRSAPPLAAAAAARGEARSAPQAAAATGVRDETRPAPEAAAWRIVMICQPGNQAYRVSRPFPPGGLAPPPNAALGRKRARVLTGSYSQVIANIITGCYC